MRLAAISTASGRCPQLRTIPATSEASVAGPRAQPSGEERGRVLGREHVERDGPHPGQSGQPSPSW